MNSCVLMVRVIQDPELRYTQENQTPVARMLVEFDSVRDEDPPYTLRVVGWGNLATEIEQKYTTGDRLIIEGRLSMNVFERPEGFKEKRAELVVSRIHPLEGSTAASGGTFTSRSQSNVVEMDSFKSSSEDEYSDFEPETSPPPVTTSSESSEQNLDDIPF